MEYYLSVLGERTGPHSQFGIIERIRDGSLTGEELVWQMGMADWKPLRELNEFTEYWQPVPEIISQAEEARRIARISLDTPQPWPRFWARMVDYIWFSSLLWSLLIAFLPADTLHWLTKMFFRGAPLNSIFFLFFALIEAWWLSRGGTTPGKALMRVRVRRMDGKLPTYRQALTRSLLVFFKGAALWLFPLNLFTMSWSRLRLLQNGTTSWDRDTELRVEHGDPEISTYVSLFVVLVLISLAIGFIFSSSPAFMAGLTEALQSLRS